MFQFACELTCIAFHPWVFQPVVSIEQEFNKAVEKFRAGQFRPAEKILLKINKRQAGIPDVLHILAFIAMETDRPKTAVKYLSQAVKRVPNNGELFNLLGSAHHKKGDVDSAIAAFSKAVSLEPGLAVARFNLANALHDANQLEKAVAEYRRLIELTPEDAIGHNGLGQALWGIGEHDSALNAYAAALECDPGDAENHFNMGYALAQNDRLEEARKHLSQAIEIDSEMLNAMYCLAGVFHKMGNPEDAISVILKAVTQDPANDSLHRLAGVIYQDLGRIEKALSSAEEARRLKPDNAENLYVLWRILEKSNKLDEALNVVTQGLKIAPDDIGLNISAARIAFRAEDYEKALGILLSMPMDEDMQIELQRDRYFELAQVYDRLGNADEAYVYFTKGNEASARSWQSPQSNKDVMVDYINRHLDVVTKPWISTWSSPLDTNQEEHSPVFMIGFPRSGTTLVDQILDSHPNIQVLEEEPMLQRVRADMAGSGSDYPEIIAGLSTGEIARLRRLYFETADQFLERKEDSLFIDKMPLNMVEAALIHRLFPDAKFILSLRHPCDACLSCFMQFFESNAGMSNFLTLEDTTKFYENVMLLWQRYESLLPLTVFRLRYEDLIDDLEGKARELAEFLELPWDDAMLNFHRHAATRNIKTPSSTQVTEKIYTRARYRWLRYEKYLNPMLNRLQPFIDEFGYGEPK